MRAGRTGKIRGVMKNFVGAQSATVLVLRLLDQRSLYRQWCGEDPMGPKGED